MTASRRFRFVQFEFPWALGPQAGRYMIRERLGEAPAYVLVQLRVAFEAALAELEPWSARPALAKRLAELGGRREDIDGAADAALRGGIDDDHIEAVRNVLGQLESALQARTAGGFG